MPTWLAYLWYEAHFFCGGMAMALGFSLRTEGWQHVPRNGPALLISNHQSYLDPTLAGLAARRHLCFLAKQELFENRLFAFLIRGLNAVPINQQGIGIEGLRLLLQKLREGWAVMIFPEGNRTGDGRIQPLQPGIHLLIRRVPAPIIPMGIAGAFEAWPRNQLLPIPVPLFLPAAKGTIAVSVGPPLDPGRFETMPREQALDELGQILQHQHDRANRLRRQP
jgi:1-acyl-sn-glycerol-3-phosphate acyltransferase